MDAAAIAQADADRGISVRHLLVGVLELAREFGQSKLAAGIAEVGAQRFAASQGGVAGSALAFAEEEPLARGDVALGRGVECRSVHGADEGCQRLQLIFGQRERRHAGGSAFLNDVVDLTQGAATEASSCA